MEKSDYDAIAHSWGWFKLRRGWYHPFAEQYVGYVGYPMCYPTSEQLCKSENLHASRDRDGSDCITTVQQPH